MIKALEARLSRLTPRTFLILLCIAQSIFCISNTLVLQTPTLDTIEMTVIGRDLILGYPKHPMLPGWLTHFVLYFASDIVCIVTLISLQMILAYLYIFKLADLLFNDENQAIAATICTAIPLSIYGFSVSMVNNVTIQLPLCSALFYYCYKTIQDNSIKNLLTFSIISGLLLNTHYLSSISIFAALLAIISLSKQKWIHIVTFLVIIIILLFPHLFYLYEHNFINVKYGHSRIDTTYNLLLSSLQIALVPLLVITIYYRNFFKNSKEHLFINIIYLTPIVIALIINLIVHFSSRWLLPFYIPFGLFVVNLIEPIIKKRNFLFLIFLIISAISLAIMPMQNRTSFPSQLIYQITFERNQDIKYISGSMFQAGSISLRAPNHPHVVFDGDFVMSPWINQNDFYKSKVLYIWEEGDEPQTPNLIESGEIEYAKISRYNKTKGNKFLYWKIVDYAKEQNYKHS